MALPGLSNSLKAPNFSRLYVESAALSHPQTQALRQKFPHAQLTEITHYKEVFNRFNQDFQLQKESQALILAHKQNSFLYPVSPEIIGHLGLSEIYYASSILNCIYHCDYCYLQGMYPSGYPVIFVNIEDFTRHATQTARAKGSLYVAVSYDSDLMAFESWIPHTAEWIKTAQATPELTLEIRTKSANYQAIAHLKPCANVILAWTLSPHVVSQRYEAKTPSLAARLSCVKAAIADGWQVRLCLDPILKIKQWETVYETFVSETFSQLDPLGIRDVCLNVFRMNQHYLKTLQQQEKASDILYEPFVREETTCTYRPQDRDALLSAVSRQVAQYLPAEKIHIA